MKKAALLALILGLALNGLQSFAMMTVEQTTSEEYLLNSRYSPETVRLINIIKVDPYEPLKVKEPADENKFVNYLKRFGQYMDPAADDGRFGHGIIDPNLVTPSQL